MASIEFASSSGYRDRGGGRAGDVISVGPTSSILVLGVDVGDVQKAPQGETLEDTIAEFQRIAGTQLANQVRATLARMLAVGPTKIGFTGKAARNIQVDYVPIQRERAYIRIYEGTLTSANKFIREGMTPSEAQNGSNGQDLNTWMRWVQYRGLKYIDPADAEDGSADERSFRVSVKSYQYNKGKLSRISNEATRDTKKRHQQVNEWKGIVYRVWRSMARKGASVWMQKHREEGGGKMFFNYPQKFLDDHEANLRDDIANIAQGQSWRNRIQGTVTNVIIGAKSTALSGVHKNKQGFLIKGQDRWNTTGN